MNVPLTMGEQLTDLRKEKKMTLAKVAEKSGLSISTISNYENDKSSPTYDNLVKCWKYMRFRLENFWTQYILNMKKI